MNLKTDSNPKESTPREIKRQKEQIAGLIGSLKDLFHGVAQNMAAGAELPGNGLLSTRKYGTERVEEFIKKKLLFQEVSFYATL